MKEKVTRFFSGNEYSHGLIGALFVVVIMILLVIFAFLFTGNEGIDPCNPPINLVTPMQGPGYATPTPSPCDLGGSDVYILTPVPNTPQKRLQMLTFGGIYATPTPPNNTVPKADNACPANLDNSEQNIIIGTDPAPGSMINAQNGIIRIWVADEDAPIIDQIDQVGGDGTITRSAAPTGNATGGYFSDTYYYIEPTLYVDPFASLLPGNLPLSCNDTGTQNNGCYPHFPVKLLGSYNTDNNGPGPGSTAGQIEGTYANFENGPDYVGSPVNPLPNPNESDYKYATEYFWNANQLGLQPGTEMFKFVIHDGDADYGMFCFPLTIALQ